MKKRTKEIWAGVLVLSILLSTPTSMEAAKTSGRKQVEKGQMVSVDRSQQPHVRDEETTNKETNEETNKNTSESISTDTSEILPEESSEETSETISEIFSEDISSEDLSETIESEVISLEAIESEVIPSETISSEAFEDISEIALEHISTDFVIDTTLPIIVIDGVQDGSANNGAILPVVSVFDSNIEISDITVSVMTGSGDSVDIAIQTEDINSEDSTGYRLTLTDMTEKADNVYHLTVSARDKAGNEAVLTYRFSLNRSGSVYDLISLTQLIERQYNTYGELKDIQIIEMNIDTVEEFELYVSRNGTLGYEAEYTREMIGSQEVGYTYVYTIAKENFTKEGIYRLTLYSRDRAGNEVNNVADIHGEEISFIVDNTAPKVVIDGVESGMVYNVKAQKVHVAVTDNFKLAEAELTLVNNANEVLESWDYMELAGENEVLEITIPQCSETVSLLYRVKDAAGNEMQTFQGERAALADFLVTTDKYVQFINKPSKTPARRLIIFIMGAAMLSAVFVLFAKVRKKNH